LIRTVRLVMTLLSTLEAGDLCEGGLGTCSDHGGTGGIGSRNALASFLIEQTRNNKIEGKRAGRNSIKGNDKRFIRRGKTGGENEDNVFIRDSDVNFRKLESDATDICNPGLNRLCISFLHGDKTATEGETRGKASRLVESVKIFPNNLGVRVTNMGKLRGGNTKNDLSTGELLLVEKSFDSLGVGAPHWLGNRAINNTQKVLPDKDCLHKEGPFMVIGLVEQSEGGSFVGHRKWQSETSEPKMATTDLRTTSNPTND